jgi:hypothetical protein
MSGFERLDVVIGIIFIFLQLSLICLAFHESIEAWVKKRATYLEWGIRELLDDPGGKGLVEKLYNHPLICGLFGGTYNPEWVRNWWGRTNLPSYIPARNFALALMDTVLHSPSPARVPRAGADSGPTEGGTGDVKGGADYCTAISIESLRNAINNIDNEQVPRSIRTFVDHARDDISKVRERIAAWYNSLTDRVAGWYKRYAQVYILVFGLLAAIILNVDTVAVVQSLSLDPTLRNAIVAASQQYVANHPSLSSLTSSSTSASPPSSSLPTTACQKDGTRPSVIARGT